MDKFLDNLYSYDNFGIYLIIAIVILVVLFFVILFFGKKDKKNRELEETKRLEKLNPDLFKIDNNEKESENKEENVIEEEIKPIINEPVLESNEVVEEKIVETPIVDLKAENEPLLEKEEEKPLIIEDEQEPVATQVENEPNEGLPIIPSFNPEEIIKDVEEIKLSEIKEEPKEEIVPEVKEEKPAIPNVEVFSSVYVPKEENVVNEEAAEDDFELPALKAEAENEPVVDSKDENNANSFSSFDLDSISGESYDINK